MSSAIPMQCSTDWAIKPSISQIPFRTEFFSGFNFTTAQVVCINAMLNHKFISFSAVQIYDLSYIHLQTLSPLFTWLERFFIQIVEDTASQNTGNRLNNWKYYIQPWLFVLDTLFSVAWHKIVMQRSLLEYQWEIIQKTFSWFLGSSHSPLKKIQVARAIFHGTSLERTT